MVVAASTDRFAAYRAARRSAHRDWISRRTRRARAKPARQRALARSCPLLLQLGLPKFDLLGDAFGCAAAFAVARAHRTFERQDFINVLGDLGLDLFQFADRETIQRDPETLRPGHGLCGTAVSLTKGL